jgi:hypothetical protein
MIDMNEINQKTADVLRNTWVILEMARDQFAEEPPQGMVPANGHILPKRSESIRNAGNLGLAFLGGHGGKSRHLLLNFFAAAVRALDPAFLQLRNMKNLGELFLARLAGEVVVRHGHLPVIW